VHDDIGASGAIRQHGRERLRGQIYLAFHRHGGLDLEQAGAFQRADHHLGGAIAELEAMPCQPIEPVERDVGDERADAERVAGKADVERMAHEAAAAVGADQISHADLMLSTVVGNARDHRIGILREAGKPATEARAVPQLGEPLAHHRLGPELRDHERAGIRFGRARRAMLHHRRFLAAAIGAIFTLRRIGPAGGGKPIDKPEILQHLLRARLDPLAARTAEGVLVLLDQQERNAPPREIDREREAGRAGTADEDIDIERHWRLRNTCALCT
jgi:hypothetical protein